MPGLVPPQLSAKLLRILFGPGTHPLDRNVRVPYTF
jgi:hypothetical protein